MVSACCACGSRHQKGTGLTFHRFPRDEELRKEWLKAIKKEGYRLTEHSVLCSNHFKYEDFNINFGKKTVKPGKVPSLSLWNPITAKGKKRNTFKYNTSMEESSDENAASEDAPPNIETIYIQMSPSETNDHSYSRIDTSLLMDERKVVYNKRQVFCGDYAENDMQDANKARKFFEAATTKMKNQKTTIRTLRQQNSRMNLRIRKLKDEVEQLKEKAMYSENSFKLKSSLDCNLGYRIIANTGEPIFHCGLCGHNTQSLALLRAHVDREHSNEHVFQCNFCEQIFSQFKALKSHINNRHAEEEHFKCSHCAYETNRQDEFITHVSKEHTKIFQCDKCEYLAKTLSSLEEHVRDVHCMDYEEKYLVEEY